MALTIPPAAGKFLYGALFVILLPAALFGWAVGARSNVNLPCFESAGWGTGLGFAGFVLWCTGVVTLRIKGGGLPMNAYPPSELVTGGVYAAIAHPIYAGFVCLCFGISIGFGSPAGQWLVSPVVGLAAAALWWGYERSDLRARLGSPPRAAWFSVPFKSVDPPRLLQRLGSLVMQIAVPVAVALMLHGAGLAGNPSYLQEQAGPRVWLAAVLLCAAVLAAKTRTDLRDIVLSSWLGSLVTALFVLTLPFGPFGGRLPLAPDGALVAVMVMPALSSLLGGIGRLPGVARWVIAVAGGFLLTMSGEFLLWEPVVGAVAYTLAAARWFIWRAALRICQSIADCWRESNFGALRIIHIGWLAALPAGGGAAGAVVLLGPSGASMTLWAFAFIIIGSALWAQIVEGSPALSRPYGFFGGVLAILVFALLVAPTLFGASPWLVLGTFAMVAPWAQGLARLRCVANGCCHGAPCEASCGIVYRNLNTRVVRIANLGGVPIHPTQLYSLAGNILIGAMVMRLWAERASLALIAGIYLALMGLARFVEEAWRGEPQTPVYGGLRLYQWASIVCFAGGAALTAVRGTPRAPVPYPCLSALWTGLAAGALTWFVVSVDFPRSRRRFARLA
jgi:prolipoprotein diacylglyceryltransferase/protein-S-isoprenylcysteine O-methyltransferase Ste14